MSAAGAVASHVKASLHTWIRQLDSAESKCIPHCCLVSSQTSRYEGGLTSRSPSHCEAYQRSATGSPSWSAVQLLLVTEEVGLQSRSCRNFRQDSVWFDGIQNP